MAKQKGKTVIPGFKIVSTPASWAILRASKVVAGSISSCVNSTLCQIINREEFNNTRGTGD